MQPPTPHPPNHLGVLPGFSPGPASTVAEPHPVLGRCPGFSTSHRRSSTSRTEKLQGGGSRSASPHSPNLQQTHPRGWGGGGAARSPSEERGLRLQHTPDPDSDTHLPPPCTCQPRAGPRPKVTAVCVPVPLRARQRFGEMRPVFPPTPLSVRPVLRRAWPLSPPGTQFDRPHSGPCAPNKHGTPLFTFTVCNGHVSHQPTCMLALVCIQT